MDARAESHVAVVFAIQDDLVGLLELARVAVGSRKGHQDAVPGLHWAALKLGIAVHDASHGDRRVGPQQLFDGCWPEVGIGAQLLAMFGVPGQVPQ